MSQAIFGMDGKVVLITGASGSLGQHFSKVLAKAGAQVIVSARSEDKLESLVNEIQARGGNVYPLAMDVSSADSVTAAFEQMLARVLVPDVVVNNAGLSVTKPLLAHSAADWDKVLDTNLKGSWLVATEAARHWVQARRPGTIVNIASILGERVIGGVAPYAISKAGLIQATKAMALELSRHDIRVNALLPGYVITDLNRDFLRGDTGEKLRMRIPSRRFCEPEDLDGPLLLLASEAGRAMSGSCLVVDRAHLVSGL